MNSNPHIDRYYNKFWHDAKGRLHRDGDLPAIEWAGGTKWWYKNGTKLSDQEVEALKRKWTAIRNGNTDLLSKEILDSL